jgi:ABC-2 type transport system ATP-binding protein
MDRDRRQPGWGVPPRLAAGADGGIREVAPLPLLELAGVSKSYRDPMTLRPFTAVEAVTLTLERGEIFGILGPNGAGKTTTLKMILGIARPTAGTVRLEGRDPRDSAARRRLGYLPENPCFYDHLTPLEFLGMVGDLFGIEPGAVRRRADALLARLGLAEHARKPLRKFSKGMTQRLGLAQALLNEPTFLVLDEPMSGLDPIGRAEVKQILREERDRGATILLTSHVLAEVESICDRVGIFRSGRLVEVGSVPGLLASGVREWEIATEAFGSELVAALRSRGHHVQSVGSRVIVKVEETDALQRVLRELTQGGIRIHSVEPRRETLEEHFVRALRGDGKGRA